MIHGVNCERSGIQLGEHSDDSTRTTHFCPHSAYHWRLILSKCNIICILGKEWHEKTRGSICVLSEASLYT